MSPFFLSFLLGKNQYSFVLTKESKATSGVGSPIHVADGGKRSDNLGSIFSQFQMNAGLFHLHGLFGALVSHKKFSWF